VDLAHGTLEGFGVSAVVLTELRIAVDVRIGVALAVFLPQQHQRHALAAQLLMHLGEVRGDKTAGTHNHTQQAVMQFGFAHGLDLGPVQALVTGKFDVLGDNAFGEAQRGSNVPLGMVKFEFETQHVFDLTHSDPSDIRQVVSSEN